MQRLFALKHTGLVVIASLLLSACGFQLRGSVPISADKQQVYLSPKQALSPMEKVLRQTLKDNGVTLTNKAPYTLRIESSRVARDSSVINTSGEVTVYTLRLEVDYRIDKPSTEASYSFTETLERNYSYDTNAAVANTEQESVIVQELYRAAANRIIRRFVAVD
ncbi:MAG: LPS assembly lipoprotein LptE [Pontibacterium sp.]